MSVETIVAAFMVVNILMVIAMWTFAWRINRDWCELHSRMNQDWKDFYDKLIGNLDKSGR